MFVEFNIALLDEMDPLAALKSNSTRKTPQSFLGENSALVNLDQLIKTSNPTNPGQAAYNPFGDLSQPPKPNLFQQQMQPVINQYGVYLHQWYGSGYFKLNFFCNYS